MLMQAAAKEVLLLSRSRAPILKLRSSSPGDSLPFEACLEGAACSGVHRSSSRSITGGVHRALKL